MPKLFIEDLPIKGKRVIMRVDFNVPLDADLNVVDASRIEAALPSIQYILDQGGSLILMSHLGRPRNAHNQDLSLAPCAKFLSASLERPVQMAPDCIGHEVDVLIEKMKFGDILLLENLRFHRAEEHPEEDPQFAKTLASYADLYVNDAFGTAHRKHSSTYTITKHFPGKAAAGYLLEKEIRFLGEALSNPKRPFVAIIGGAKISTKIGVIKSLLKKVNALLIGGGMAYTFLKAKGIDVGSSIFEDELIPTAHEILQDAQSNGVEILLPLDIMAAREYSEDAQAKLVSMQDGIPSGYQGLDIGPQTIESFSETLILAGTILWNGPLGVYEFDRFAKGTQAIAHVVASTQAVSIIGGGDLNAAVKKAGLSDKFTHISTGGGATLEYIEFGTLPCIEALSEKSSPKL